MTRAKLDRQPAPPACRQQSVPALALDHRDPAAAHQPGQPAMAGRPRSRRSLDAGQVDLVDAGMDAELAAVASRVDTSRVQDRLGVCTRDAAGAAHLSSPPAPRRT
jgi:hypothetical protein